MSRLLMAPDQLDRLAKVLGMLGSAHDGEVLSAGRRAHGILRASGLTWQQIIRGDTIEDRSSEFSDRRMVDACVDAIDLCIFDAREVRFIVDVANRVRHFHQPLSSRQHSWLQALHRRAETLRRAAA